MTLKIDPKLLKLIEPEIKEIWLEPFANYLKSINEYF